MCRINFSLPYSLGLFLLLSCCSCHSYGQESRQLTIQGKTELIVTELPFSVLAPPDNPQKTLFFWTVPPGAEVVDNGAELKVIRFAGNHLFQCRVVTWTPDGFQQETYQLRIRFQSPEPIPPPPPPVPPEPPEPPTPEVKTLWLVVVEETADAKEDRAAWLTYAPLVDYFKAKKHRFRVIDKDVKGPDGQPPRELQPYIAAAQVGPLPFLFLVNESGDVLYRGGLPSTPADLLSLVKKVGG